MSNFCLYGEEWIWYVCIRGTYRYKIIPAVVVSFYMKLWTHHLYLQFILSFSICEAIICTELLTCAFCTDNEMKQKWWLEATFNKNNKDLYFLEKDKFQFCFSSWLIAVTSRLISFTTRAKASGFTPFSHNWMQMVSVSGSNPVLRSFEISSKMLNASRASSTWLLAESAILCSAGIVHLETEKFYVMHILSYRYTFSTIHYVTSFEITSKS